MPSYYSDVFLGDSPPAAPRGPVGHHGARVALEAPMTSTKAVGGSQDDGEERVLVGGVEVWEGMGRIWKRREVTSVE